jgi:hypothetical protein
MEYELKSLEFDFLKNLTLYNYEAIMRFARDFDGILVDAETNNKHGYFICLQCHNLAHWRKESIDQRRPHFYHATANEDCPLSVTGGITNQFLDTIPHQVYPTQDPHSPFPTADPINQERRTHEQARTDPGIEGRHRPVQIRSCRRC